MSSECKRKLSPPETIDAIHDFVEETSDGYLRLGVFYIETADGMILKFKPKESRTKWLNRTRARTPAKGDGK